MRKNFIVTLLASALSITMLASCGSDTAAKSIKVKNGYIHMSVDEFEDSFNALLDAEYSEAQLQKRVSDETSFNSCYLGEDIQLYVLGTTDYKKISSVQLSCDVLAAEEAMGDLGYYYTNAIYTVAPDITSDEVIDILDELETDIPEPGENTIVSRDNFIYAIRIGNDYSVTFSIVAC